jgi:hypothetical protein
VVGAVAAAAVAIFLVAFLVRRGAPIVDEPLRVPVIVEYRDPEGRRQVIATGTWTLPRSDTYESAELTREFEDRIRQTLNPITPRPIPPARMTVEEEPFAL